MLLKRIITVALSLTMATNLFADNWKLKKTDDDLGIKVYVRDVTGSPLKEFKGVTNLKSTLNSSVALISDTENLPNWIYNMLSIEVLEKVNEHETYAYSVNKTGPFMDNRDSVVYSVLMQDPTSKVVTITLEGKPAYIPPSDDAVRVASLKGLWQFTPNNNGTVEVVYQLHVDPSARLPQSMINRFIVRSSLETLAEMHKQIEKYQNKNLAYIME